MAKSWMNAPEPPESDAELEIASARVLDDPWMTERRAAAYLGYSYGSLRNLRAEGLGRGPVFAINAVGTVRYKRSDLDAWQRSGGPAQVAG